MAYAGSAISSYMILLQHYQYNIEETSNCNIEIFKGTVKFFATHNVMFIEAL